MAATAQGSFQRARSSLPSRMRADRVALRVVLRTAATRWASGAREDSAAAARGERLGRAVRQDRLLPGGEHPRGDHFDRDGSRSRSRGVVMRNAPATLSGSGTCAAWGSHRSMIFRVVLSLSYLRRVPPRRAEDRKLFVTKSASTRTVGIGGPSSRSRQPAARVIAEGVETPDSWSSSRGTAATRSGLPVTAPLCGAEFRMARHVRRLGRRGRWRHWGRSGSWPPVSDDDARHRATAEGSPLSRTATRSGTVPSSLKFASSGWPTTRAGAGKRSPTCANPRGSNTLRQARG